MAAQLNTIPETAAKLRVSAKTVYRLIAAGDLESCDAAPSGTGTPKTRVADTAIAAFIAERTRKPKAVRTT